MQRRRTGFTLVELLVVIGIIALLISILLPTLGKARERAKNIKCMSQLRNVGQSIVMYVGENRGRIPQHPSKQNGLWLWDVPFGTRDALIKKGAIRQTLYCPFFDEQNVDPLWNGTFGGGQTDYSVLGYIWLGKRWYQQNQTPPYSPVLEMTGVATLQARAYVEQFKAPPVSFPASPPVNAALKAKLAPLFPRAAAEVEVMADSIIQQNGTWTAKGGWSELHVSSHMNKQQPAGANVLFLDGHVSFRPYNPKTIGLGYTDSIQSRAKFANGGGDVEFWF